MLFETPGLSPPGEIVTDKSAGSITNKKRKRNAGADEQHKAGKVVGAEINLDKLMKQMEMVGGMSKPKNSKDNNGNKQKQQAKDGKQSLTVGAASQSNVATRKPSLEQQQQHRLDQMSQRQQPANDVRQRNAAAAGEHGGKRRRTEGPQSEQRHKQQQHDESTSSSKPQSKRQKKAARKQHQQQQQQAAATPVADEDEPAAPSTSRTYSAPTQDEDDGDQDDGSAAATPQTAFQASLRAKLAGGKFRMLNEKLYTTSGREAADYMKQDGAFDDYHAGFRSQASHWPVQPLTLIQNSLKASLEPNSLVVDFGCGDATLARHLVKHSSLKVISFDLVSKDAWVVEAECSSVPLPGGRKGGQVVDAVVCSLSLMGTDWIAMIWEAHRVLKDGGQLKIAEVTSRFNDNIDSFVEVVSSVGFKLTDKDTSNTHFVMFDFVKDDSVTESSSGASRSATTAKASSLLKPCIYKRR
ncbi:hypothetical protein ACM66B_005918 [Microbotryomycetes sp. NB124-2]